MGVGIASEHGKLGQVQEGEAVGARLQAGRVFLLTRERPLGSFPTYKCTVVLP